MYWLYPDELETVIPIIERCMIDGMRMATPDVAVGVETTCMHHWDKGAKEFEKLKALRKDNEPWDYVIEEPAFVQALNKKNENNEVK